METIKGFIGRQELIDLLDTSKFGSVEYTPYQVYLKALFEVFRADLEAAGGVPATIGVLDGAVRVGLGRAELERLAASPEAAKVNPGNLAAVVASGAPGSTTVAATMFAAAAVGIRVLATGGIGGVHRDAASGDVSADLTALARHPVAVVCAGAKAVLDLPRTVEALETLGVPVLGHGTDEFPAFYRRGSGLRVDRRCDTVAELAAAVICRLGTNYDALAKDPGVVVSAWRARAAPWWGGMVEVRTGDGEWRGRLLEVDEDGALVVEVEGRRRRLLSGEVTRLRAAAAG